jgi:methionine biosynthesis protein MetW
MENRLTKVVKLLRKKQFDSCLDIGCGEGSITIFLAQIVKAKDIKGVEVVEERVNKAKGKGIECYKVDVDSAPLPFENNTIDFAFCGDVIEHLYNPSHLLEEVSRVLIPHGKIIITTPNLGAWHARLLLLLGYQPYNVHVSFDHYEAGKLFKKAPDAGRDHIRFFTLRGLIDLLQINGFKVNRVLGNYGVLFFLPSLLASLVTLISKSFSIVPSLANGIVIEAEKKSVAGLAFSERDKNGTKP